jgi:hypothetical protein
MAFLSVFYFVIVFLKPFFSFNNGLIVQRNDDKVNRNMFTEFKYTKLTYLYVK